MPLNGAPYAPQFAAATGGRSIHCMKNISNTKTISEGLSQLLSPGHKIVAGLFLIAAGLPLSLSVFIGDPGNQTVWWPVLIFIGMAWTTMGIGGLLKSRLGRSLRRVLAYF